MSQERRSAVKEPRWGTSLHLLAYIQAHGPVTIEVGPRRARYTAAPAAPGEDARRAVFLNGEEVGFVYQYTAPSFRRLSGTRLVSRTGTPTRWVPSNGGGVWDDFSQMNEAVYALVDTYLQKRSEQGE